VPGICDTAAIVGRESCDRAALGTCRRRASRGCLCPQVATRAVSSSSPCWLVCAGSGSVGSSRRRSWECCWCVKVGVSSVGALAADGSASGRVAAVRGVSGALPVITQRGAEPSRHHLRACRSTAGDPSGSASGQHRISSGLSPRRQSHPYCRSLRGPARPQALRFRAPRNQRSG
jgi:hypothetical protein